MFKMTLSQSYWNRKCSGHHTMAEPLQGQRSARKPGLAWPARLTMTDKAKMSCLLLPLYN